MDAAGPAVAILILVGLVAAFVLSIPAVAGAFDRHRWVQLDLGLLLVISIALMVVYAGSDDGYYGSGVSRWDHGTRFVGSGVLLACLIAGIVAAAGVVAVSLVRGRLRRLGMPLVLLGFLALAVGWFSLTAGH